MFTLCFDLTFMKIVFDIYMKTLSRSRNGHNIYVPSKQDFCFLLFYTFVISRVNVSNNIFSQCRSPLHKVILRIIFFNKDYFWFTGIHLFFYTYGKYLLACSKVKFTKLRQAALQRFAERQLFYLYVINIIVQKRN